MNYLSFPTLALLLLLHHFLDTVSAQGSNVVMSQSGIAIATQGSRGGLLVQNTLTGSQAEFPLPGVVSLDDLAMDSNQNVFALSTSTPPRLCSYSLTGDELSLVNCVGSSFAVSPFTGVAAKNGIVVISGGIGGLTVFEYNASTGFLSSPALVENLELEGVIGHPDVTMIDATHAALSTDFSGGGNRFGTLVAMISGDTASPLNDFRVPNSIGFDLIGGNTNFPLVNAIYFKQTTTFMYTANGAMTVQDPFDSSKKVMTIVGGPAGFDAVTVAVNPELTLVVFGGLVNGLTSQLVIFDISTNPTLPEFVSTAPVSGRITSVASRGTSIAYMTMDGTAIQRMSMEQDNTNNNGVPAPTPIGEGEPSMSSDSSSQDPNSSSVSHDKLFRALLFGMTGLAWLVL